MTRFTRRIRPHVDAEIAAARHAHRNRDAGAAFTHLERAHVLGQSSTWLHVRVHLLMLLWGLRERRPREAAGQVLRVAGAAAKTPFGKVPTGNTGGANVSAFRRMPIDAELQRLIDRAQA
jgi:hypothetical protein